MLRHIIPLLAVLSCSAAEPDFPLTADSKPQPGTPKGRIIKGTYTATADSVFPGTSRDYQIYLPAVFDNKVPTPFMVFQDGVIYQAPTVFDNLIAKKDLPPLAGVFIKPGVVPAANDNALPRFNRSYEYDSITDTYSRFLIDEFLPALEKAHNLTFSRNPNEAAIAGNSSGGICAFMVGWHRPDRFRRIFTGVGTYVGIHGADQLPVLVRKIEPKPLRLFLQSGTGDNNLYCGDWWMANQTMERSLTWAGYDVNHAWGEGGHNQKHASQVFPDAMRWLWRDWQTDKTIRPNPESASQWRGYDVLEKGEEWRAAASGMSELRSITADLEGTIFATDSGARAIWKVQPKLPAMKQATFATGGDHGVAISAITISSTGALVGTGINNRHGMSVLTSGGDLAPFDSSSGLEGFSLCQAHDGWFYMSRGPFRTLVTFPEKKADSTLEEPHQFSIRTDAASVALSPDQTQLYATSPYSAAVTSFQIDSKHRLTHEQSFILLQPDETGEVGAAGLCVDIEGRIYVATNMGLQVCDQAGRVNFIIPTPQPPSDVCFGGKDLTTLHIACGDTIYTRSTRTRGIISAQQPPIKPPPPKL